jgi:threonine/homoserine/homoserine lactone efflux protein
MLSLVLSGVALGFAVAAPIGPVNLALIRRGLLSGFMPAWMVGLGAALADALCVFLIFLGVAPLIEHSLAFRLALWGLGGAFLVYLGIAGLRPRAVLDGAVLEGAPRGEVHPFFTGLGITLFNPMTVVSWLAVAGAFFSTLALTSVEASGFIFVAGIFVGSALWSFTVAFVTHFARRLVNARALSVVSAVAALALIGFGLGFLFQAMQTLWSG